MSDFTWLENGSMRCLLVSAAFPLPHESPATLADIEAALAERGLVVIPGSAHSEEVAKRDEEIARLTARVAELEQEATELEGMLHNKALDSARIASELTDQLEAAEKRVEELSAELASCRKALEAARRVGRLLREDALASAGKDSGPTCSRCGGSGRHPTSGGDCKPCDGSGKDSGEGNPPGIPDSSPEPAATVPRGEVEELLRRIVKYAIEDRAYTPGSTRLARAINEARKLLAKGEETP